MEKPRRLANGRYQARYRDLSGKRRSAGTFSTSKDAARAQVRAIAALDRPQTQEPLSARITLAEYAPKFLTYIAPRVVEGTVANHERNLRLHILPVFGGKRLGEIRHTEVAAWVDSFRTIPLRRQCYGTLSKLMRLAVKDELLLRSPCGVEGASAHAPRNKIAYTDEQVGSVLCGLPERYLMVAVVQYGAALRISETLGLNWGDIDLETGAVLIEKQCYQSRMVYRTKTKRTRTAYLTKDALEVFRAFAKKNRGIGTAPVFLNSRGVRANDKNVRHAMHKAREAAGLPKFVPHDLRATDLSLFYSHTTNLVLTMDRGGHTDSRSALVYQRVPEGRPAALADFRKSAGG